MRSDGHIPRGISDRVRFGIAPLAAALVAAALLALGACGDGEGVARTRALSPSPLELPGPTMAPAAGPGKTVAVWGDVRNSGSDTDPSDGFVRVVRALGAFRFGASIGLGDYIDASEDESEDREKYENLLAAARPLVARGRVVWVPGNHEKLTHEVDHRLWHEMIWGEEVPPGDPAANQRHHWGPFELTVGTKTLRVFMLSSDDQGAPDGTIGFKTAKRDTTPGSAWLAQTRQARALVNWLAKRPRTQYVVVAVHHPLLDPKTDAAYMEEPYTAERDALVRLFSRSGVDLVLQGDVHNYRRHVAPSGTVYVTQGMGGAPPDSALNSPAHDDVARKDAQDASILGSESGGADRYGFTIIRQTKAGGLKGMTYFVSDEQETVGGKVYPTGRTILYDVFKVPRISKGS